MKNLKHQEMTECLSRKTACNEQATKNYQFTHKRSPARISLVKGERYSRYAEEPELDIMRRHHDWYTIETWFWRVEKKCVHFCTLSRFSIHVLTVCIFVEIQSFSIALLKY